MEEFKASVSILKSTKEIISVDLYKPSKSRPSAKQIYVLHIEGVPSKHATVEASFDIFKAMLEQPGYDKTGAEWVLVRERMYLCSTELLSDVIKVEIATNLQYVGDWEEFRTHLRKRILGDTPEEDTFVPVTDDDL